MANDVTMLGEVKERSAARLTVDFLDFDEKASIPSKVTYRVYVMDADKTELRAETDVTNDVDGQTGRLHIFLTSVDTKISANGVTRGQETHRVFVHSEYGTQEDEANDIYDFTVVSLGLNGP